MRAEAPSPDHYRLDFEDVGAELLLSGFSFEMAVRLSKAWACRLDELERPLEGAFRLELVADPTLRWTGTSVRRAVLEGELVHERVGEHDELVLPGARIELQPGRNAARLRLHPELFDRPALLQLAAEGALTQALPLQGAVRLHAAGFELDGTPLLAVGPSGAGKSTLAALVLAHGDRIVSDDSLIVGRSSRGRVTARPSRSDLLFRDPTPKLLPQSVRRHLDRTAVGSEHKWRLSRKDAAGACLPSITPKVVLFLDADRRRRRRRLEPVTQAHALATLLQTTVSAFQMGPGYEQELEAITELFVDLLKQAEAYGLRTGRVLGSAEGDSLLHLLASL